MELNLFTFGERFPTEDACYSRVMQVYWPNGPICITCGSVSVYASKTRRMFKCKDCGRQFSPLSGTIFQDTHLPLRKWFLAAYLLSADGIAANQLYRRIGVTKKTAWFLVQRIMGAMEDANLVLEGPVQIDEMYVGPKSRGRTSARYSNKYAVIGGVEDKPNGRMVVEVVKQPDATVAMDFIRRRIKPGSVITTDDSRIYHNLKHQYQHETINHSARQYVVNGVTTNRMENGWMHGKRLIKGHHIRVSGKHLSTYVAGGHQFRFNVRGNTDEERFNAWLGQTRGVVLTYRQLLAKKPTKPLALRGWARKRAKLPVQTSLF